MIVLRCTRSRVARARVPGRGSPGLRRPVRMSLASASESCTNIGESRRGASAAVSNSQLSIEGIVLVQSKSQKGIFTGMPWSISTPGLPEEPHAHLHPTLRRPAARMWIERTAGSPDGVGCAPASGGRLQSQPDAVREGCTALRTEHRTVERAALELHLLDPGGPQSILRHHR